MRLRNALWLVIPNTAGFVTLSVFGLEQNRTLFPYYPACSGELQVLLGGHPFSPNRADSHRWATSIADVLLQLLLVSQYTNSLISTMLTQALEVPTEYLWLYMLMLSVNTRTNLMKWVLTIRAPN